MDRNTPGGGLTGIAGLILAVIVIGKLMGADGFVSFVEGLQGLWGVKTVSVDVSSPEFLTESYIDDLKIDFESYIDTGIFTEPVEGYDRDDWSHWDSYGSSCWNIRDEVLFRQAVRVDTMRDREGDVTEKKDEACEITSGEWLDPYTGSTFTNPQDLDIDHFVPLGEAYASGGDAWNDDKRRDYANDLSYPLHLVAVSSSANSSKGAKDPFEWMPENEAYTCQYLYHWIDIKEEWGLGMDKKEANFIENELTSC